jgi:hypothetical protein
MAETGKDRAGVIHAGLRSSNPRAHFPNLAEASFVLYKEPLLGSRKDLGRVGMGNDRVLG